MNLILEALSSLATRATWAGDHGLARALLDHLAIVAVTVAVSAVIALPLGVLIGHTGRGRTVGVVVANAARALPTLGLVTLLALGIGIGVVAPVLALTVLAVPPLLAGVYSGIDSVDRDTVQAARAVGLTERQLITQVELPLALPVMLGGARSAVLQVVATATVAAYVWPHGLGAPILSGLALSDYRRVLAASIVVIVLAVLLDLLLAGAQRALTPRGLRPSRRRRRRSGRVAPVARTAPDRVW